MGSFFFFFLLLLFFCLFVMSPPFSFFFIFKTLIAILVEFNKKIQAVNCHKRAQHFSCKKCVRISDKYNVLFQPNIFCHKLRRDGKGVYLSNIIISKVFMHSIYYCFQDKQYISYIVLC